MVRGGDVGRRRRVARVSGGGVVTPLPTGEGTAHDLEAQVRRLRARIDVLERRAAAPINWDKAGFPDDAARMFLAGRLRGWATALEGNPGPHTHTIATDMREWSERLRGATPVDGPAK